MLFTHKEDKTAPLLEVESVQDATEKLLEIYKEDVACLGEILATTELKGLTIEQVLEVVARTRKIIDDWRLIYLADKDEPFPPF